MFHLNVYSMFCVLARNSLIFSFQHSIFIVGLSFQNYSNIFYFLSIHEIKSVLKREILKISGDEKSSSKNEKMGM